MLSVKNKSIINSSTFIISMITDSCNDILGHQDKNLNSKKAVLGNGFLFLLLLSSTVHGGAGRF